MVDSPTDSLIQPTPNMTAELEKVRELSKRLRIKADIIQMGERIAFGSDSEIMREAADTLDTIIAKQKATEEALRYVKVRLVQIASGDYRACGHLAEAVALDALDKINEGDESNRKAEQVKLSEEKANPPSPTSYAGKE